MRSTRCTPAAVSICGMRSSEPSADAALALEVRRSASRSRAGRRRSRSSAPPRRRPLRAGSPPGRGSSTASTARSRARSRGPARLRAAPRPRACASPPCRTARPSPRGRGSRRRPSSVSAFSTRRATLPGANRKERFKSFDQHLALAPRRIRQQARAAPSCRPHRPAARICTSAGLVADLRAAVRRRRDSRRARCRISSSASAARSFSWSSAAGARAPPRRARVPAV